MAASEQEKLTAPVLIQTDIPYESPEIPSSITGGERIPTAPQSAGKKVQVQVCSELAEYRANLEYFQKNGKVKLAYDESGQPVIFSLNEEQRLCALRHTAGGAEGWSSAFISPKGEHVSTYDVAECQSGIFVAAIAPKGTASSSTYELHCALAPIDRFFESDEAVGADLSESDAGMPWHKVKDNEKNPTGPLMMTSVMCKSVSPSTERHDLQVVVGTGETASKTGTFYRVGINQEIANPWSALSFPAAASKMLQSEPLSIGNSDDPHQEQGLISVFQGYGDTGLQRCAGHVFSPNGGFVRDFEVKAGKLGGVNAVYSHLNYMGSTDLFLAGKKGIGICNSQSQYDVVSKVLLSEIAFSQVVCAEEADPECPEDQTRLALFAVAESGELYYLDGARILASGDLNFQYSGLPIRRDVTHMSTRFNGPRCSSELLFATEKDSALHYLRRSSTGSVWTEDRITRKAFKMTKFDAFLITLVLSDGEGNPVAPGYGVTFTSEPLHLVANDQSFALSQAETVLRTDASGSILLVIPSDGKLGCPPINAAIGSYKFKVNPGQRVDRLLSKLNSADAMRDARSAQGDSIFEGLSNDKLEGASSVCGQYDEIKKDMQKPAGADVTRELGEPDKDKNWFERVVSSTEKFLGDCIEAVKTAVKTVVKVAIKILGPVVKIVFKILGKVFSFVLSGLDKLLTCIGNFLENVLGVGFLNKMLRFLKAVFNPEAIAKTQNVLKKAVSGGMKVAHRVLATNKASILDMFDDAEDNLKKYIDDPREPPRDGANLPDLSWIFNNPVVRLLSKINPLGWVMEAVAEELPDIKLPSLGPLFDGITEAIGDRAEDQLKVVMQLWDTFMAELPKVLAKPKTVLTSLLRVAKSVVWALFDSFRNLVVVIYDAITVFVRELEPLLSAPWKLGALTETWEDITGSEFSILSFITYPLAVMLNITSVSMNGKLPFEGLYNDMESIDFEAMEIKPFYVSARKAKRPTSSQANSSTNDKKQRTETSKSARLPVIEKPILQDHFESRVSSSFKPKQSGVPSNSASLAAPKPVLLDQPHLRASANSQTSTGGERDARAIILEVLSILENMSRFGMTALIYLQSQQDISNKKVQKAERGEAWKKAIEKKDAFDERWEKTIRILQKAPFFLHSIFAFASPWIREPKPHRDADEIVGLVAVGEFICASISLFHDQPFVYMAMGLAEAGTIVRVLAGQELGHRPPGQGICFISSAASGFLGLICKMLEQPEIAVVFVVGDAAGTMTGSIWTVVSLIQGP